MLNLKKGLVINYLGFDYEVTEKSRLFISLKRVNGLKNVETVQIAINSDRFKELFRGSEIDTFEAERKSAKASEVIITHKADKPIEYQTTLEGIINQLNDKEVFNSKSEATIWLYDALVNEIGLDKHLLAPLYAVVSFYTYKLDIRNIDLKLIEEYIQGGDKKAKTTNFIKLVDSVVLEKERFIEVANQIPTQYESVFFEVLLGKINLGLVITDCKVILKKYKQKRENNNMKKISDESLLELNATIQDELDERGLVDEPAEEDEATLAEVIEDSGLDNEEVIALAKEAGIKVTATKKLKESAIEDLAEAIEAKADEESLEALIETLQGDEDDADADEDDADADEDDADADEDDADENVSLSEMLEVAMEDGDPIVDILEEAGVEVKLTAKVKKSDDAEELAEVLEDKLDDEQMEELVDYLETLFEDDADADEDADEDDDDEDDDDDDYTLEDIEDMEQDEVIELCEELEITVPKKVTKVGLKKLKKAIVEELELEE